MRRTVLNIMATTGITMVVLSMVALCYDASFICISTVFQSLGLNTIIFAEVSAILTLFIFSFTIFGTIFNFASVFTKGLGIGITIYSLYSKFLIKGIIFGIFAILPGLFISSAALILFAIQSTKINILIIKKITCKDENLSILKFKLYIKALSKTLMLSALGAFVHILLSDIFLKLNFL